MVEVDNIVEKAKFSMKPLTREWVDKAEGDFITAKRELRARKPGVSAMSYHKATSLDAGLHVACCHASATGTT